MIACIGDCTVEKPPRYKGMHVDVSVQLFFRGRVVCVYVYMCAHPASLPMHIHSCPLARHRCPQWQYPSDKPLLFNVCVDPSEGIPLAGALPHGTFVNGLLVLIVQTMIMRVRAFRVMVRSRVNVGVEIRTSIKSK